MSQGPEIDGEDVEREESADNGDEAIGKGEEEIARFSDAAPIKEVGGADGVNDGDDTEGEDENGDAGFESKLEQLENPPWRGVEGSVGTRLLMGHGVKDSCFGGDLW